MKNSKSYTFGFLVDSVMKFSTKIVIFINTPKTGFLHFSIDFPVQYCPEQANFMQNFCSWYLMEKIFEQCTTLCTPRVIWI